MKLIHQLITFALLFTPVFLVIGALFWASGCASRREPWTQRPPTGPATERTVDANGNPSFGPK